MVVMSTVVHAADGVVAGGGRYLDWGVIQISLTNFLIVVAMVVVFVLALVVPFPHGDDGTDGGPTDDTK